MLNKTKYLYPDKFKNPIKTGFNDSYERLEIGIF